MSRKPHIRWTPEMDGIVRAGWRNGAMTIPEIANRLGIHTCSVRRRAKVLGLGKKSDEHERGLGILKRNDPERFERRLEDMRQKITELWASERKRQRLGLRRKTRLHLPVNVWTRSDTNRRHKALKLGYIVPVHTDIANRWVLWYDDETRRSERFERNSVNAGFKIQPL